MLDSEPGLIISCPTLVEHFDPRVTNLYVVAAAAQFLKADMTIARPVLDGRSGGAIVAFHALHLFSQVQVLHDFTVDHDFDARAFESG